MMGRPVSNKYHVPTQVWRNWTEVRRRVFNHMYYRLQTKNQWAVMHPRAPLINKGHWATLRWNVAWLAAEEADHV